MEETVVTVMKALDFLFQAFLIIWTYAKIILGDPSPWVIVPLFLVLEYQIASSLLICGVQFLKERKLNKKTTLRLVLCLIAVILFNPGGYTNPISKLSIRIGIFRIDHMIILVMGIVPLFFVLTLIDRIMDVVRVRNKK